MNVVKGLTISLVGAALVALANPAYARGDREGFNFGATLRLMDAADRTEAGGGSNDSQSSSSSQAINPHFGYAFEPVNLGITFGVSSEETRTVEEQEDGTETTRERKTKTEGASAYARFLFGEVFFFEGGLGLYREKTRNVTITTQPQDASSFQGTRRESNVTGVGPGYHFSGGMELPMGSSFRFTTAYRVRIVQLRDYKGGAALGAKRSYSQEREALFGISYYDD